MLSSLGFGNGRALDSRDYQVLRRWHELLDSFSTLDRVFRSPIRRPVASAHLVDRTARIVFRERNPGVPVEVLGVAEAMGSTFDAIWVTTLNSETWPGPVARDPLIPGSIQQSVPRATTDGCLEQARRELTALFAAAPLRRGSYARGREEIPLEPTNLLAEAAWSPAAAPPAWPSAPMEELPNDDRAPAVTDSAVRGGTGVLRDQSACPFRAFAQRRLNAVDLRPPRPGLDAGQRGDVIHRALENFWEPGLGSADLSAWSAQALTDRIEAAATQAVDHFAVRHRLTLTPTGRRLERERTARALRRWLDQERRREGFTVIQQEHELGVELGGLRLEGKIDRLDRLADGTTLLIDYKTGRASRSQWYPEPRIEDPQMPAYAVVMDPAPGAIAFGRIRPDDLRFDGLSSGTTGTPGIVEIEQASRRFSEIESWSALLAGWRLRLEALATDFLRGHAAVDPKKPGTCRHCHLHALCRIHERKALAGMDTDDDDE